MKNTPLVSIIMPVFNQEKYVGAAIDSALNQTYMNLELIVVNDGSTDRSLEIVEKYLPDSRITLISHENNINKGVSHSRKAAIDSSKGQYIAFLDSDDIFLPEKIQNQVRLFEKYTTAIMCHTSFMIINDVNIKDSDSGFDHFHLSNHELFYSRPSMSFHLKHNGICNSTVMVKADIIKKISFNYNQAFQFEDWLTWVLLSEYGRFIYTPEKLIYYRQHNESATSTINKYNQRHYYARLEFFLCLLKRTKRFSIKIKAFANILFTLSKTYRSY